MLRKLYARCIKKKWIQDKALLIKKKVRIEARMIWK